MLGILRRAMRQCQAFAWNTGQPYQESSLPIAPMAVSTDASSPILATRRVLASRAQPVDD